jgi:hypothetical protein
LHNRKLLECTRSPCDSAFKKRAPRAIKRIKEFAAKEMGTKDVRIDVALNKVRSVRRSCAAPELTRLASFSSLLPGDLGWRRVAFAAPFANSLCAQAQQRHRCLD